MKSFAEGHDSIEKEHSEVHCNSAEAVDFVAAHSFAVEDSVVRCKSVEVAEDTVANHSSAGVEDILVGHSSVGEEDLVLHHSSAGLVHLAVAQSSAEVDSAVGHNCLVETVGLFEAC